MKLASACCGAFVRRRRIGPLHPGQPAAARAAQQTQEEQLHLVVRLMGQGDGLDPSLTRRTGQEPVPDLAGRHLDRNVLFRGKPPYVCPRARERQPQSFCGRADQPFVRIACPPPKLVVEMRDVQAPAMFRRQPGHQLQQHHRVHAARHGNQDGLPGSEETPLPDGSLDALHQVTHGVMLGQ